MVVFPPPGSEETTMIYTLVPATVEDEPWLERLRRDVYQELFQATFGGWDEARHMRQWIACWERGGISIIQLQDIAVGMIQLWDKSDSFEICEVQIHPDHQNQSIGTRILADTIARAHAQGKNVTLSVGLKNVRAFRLYERLGFEKVGSDDTHNHMVCKLQ
jgi:ribosomal protein S18 acetylase RimI-like enzyme